MKTDAEPQPNIRQNSGNPAEENVERIVGARAVKGTTRKLTESPNLGSQGLTATELINKEACMGLA